MLYLTVDGTGVPMTTTETAGRAGKHPDGRARTREVKLACLFTQSGLDDNGRPFRDPNSTSYLATLDPVETFADLVQAEAHRRGAEHIRQLIILGDGDRWIWNLADKLAFIVPDPATWLDELLTDLDNGDIEALSAAARRYQLDGPKASDLDKAVN
jgi:hypothetical protein